MSVLSGTPSPSLSVPSKKKVLSSVVFPSVSSPSSLISSTSLYEGAGLRAEDPVKVMVL